MVKPTNQLHSRYEDLLPDCAFPNRRYLNYPNGWGWGPAAGSAWKELLPSSETKAPFNGKAYCPKGSTRNQKPQTLTTPERGFPAWAFEVTDCGLAALAPLRIQLSHCQSQVDHEVVKVCFVIAKLMWLWDQVLTQGRDQRVLNLGGWADDLKEARRTLKNLAQLSAFYGKRVCPSLEAFQTGVGAPCLRQTQTDQWPWHFLSASARALHSLGLQHGWKSNHDSCPVLLAT